MQRNVFGAIAQTIWCRTWKPDLLKEMRVLWVESYHSMACCICFCKPVWIIMNRENDLNCLSQGRDCLTACAHSNFRHASTYVIVRLQLLYRSMGQEWITAPPSRTAESRPGNEASWNGIWLISTSEIHLDSQRIPWLPVVPCYNASFAALCSCDDADYAMRVTILNIIYQYHWQCQTCSCFSFQDC